MSKIQEETREDKRKGNIMNSSYPGTVTQHLDFQLQGAGADSLLRMKASEHTQGGTEHGSYPGGSERRGTCFFPSLTSTSEARI